MDRQFFTGKRVLVMGLGRFGGGADVAEFAHSLGAKVTITDLDSADKLSDSIKKLEEFPDIELHLGSHDPARNTQYEEVFLTGNIGNRPMLTALERITADSIVVLELSSFQLEQLAQIKKAPKIALLTNLTPNHLDRHGTFASYCAAKENIFKFQKLDEDSPAVSIFNGEDPVAGKWFDKYSADPGRVCIKFSAGDVSEHLRRSFPLPGRANLSNLAAALAVAKYFGVPDDAIADSLPHFKPLPHRLELIGQINGVRWYNDSIATTPQSAIAALEAFAQPRIIIAGGYDKDLPFEALGQKIAGTAKAAILLGQTARKIADAIRVADVSLRGPRGRSNLKPRNKRYAIRDTNIVFAETLAEAVQVAAGLAVSGDVVLLSPACASYDMFDNFQQRGREFVRLVRDISPT